MICLPVNKVKNTLVYFVIVQILIEELNVYGDFLMGILLRGPLEYNLPPDFGI